ncbi:MAG: hypothetical protein ABMB14_08470 [Myxococcota bacterium]
MNAGVLEASGIYLYPLLLTDQVNRGVADAVRPIEDVLERFISPDGRPRSEDELVAHGWPPDDLWEVDADNF